MDGSTVWYDMVWYGEAYGTVLVRVRDGGVWVSVYERVKHATLLNDMIWYCVAWYGVRAQNGMAWYGESTV